MQTPIHKYVGKLIYAFIYCNIRGVSRDIRPGLKCVTITITLLTLLILWSSFTQPTSLWQWICNGISGDVRNSQNICCLSHIVLDNIMEPAVSFICRKKLPTHLTVSTTENILNCLFIILQKGYPNFDIVLSSWGSKISSIGQSICDVNTTSDTINFTFWCYLTNATEWTMLRGKCIMRHMDTTFI